MADKLKQIPQKLLDIWKSWSVKQRVLIIGSIVAFIAVVSIVAIVLTRPKYEVLVTCEDYTEMNSVTTLLTDNNHKYKINNRHYCHRNYGSNYSTNCFKFNY